MDTVFIEALEVSAVTGVHDWERQIRQRLRLDLALGWDNEPAGNSDALKDALDYAAVTERVTGFLSGIGPQLLETAAEGISDLLQQEFGVRWLKLVIRKPGAVPAAASVGVSIERGVR